MKRITAMLLVIALLCTAMTGCGGGAAESESTTVAATEPTTVPTTEPEKTFTVHVHGPEGWGNITLWAWSAVEGDLFDAWPGAAMTAAEDGWFTYDVPEWVDHLIIGGLGGSEKSEEIVIEPKEVWIDVKKDGTVRFEYEVFELAVEGYYEFAPGYWTLFKDGRGGSFNGLVLEETMENCYQMTVKMDITMKSGARCEYWQLIGLIGEDSYSDEILAELYLPNGTGVMDETIYFSTPVSFDALVIQPKLSGGYSWHVNSLSFQDFWFEPEA